MLWCCDYVTDVPVTSTMMCIVMDSNFPIWSVSSRAKFHWADSTCESTNSTTRQEIPHLLRKTKIHYQVQNSPFLEPILRQLNSVHILKLHTRSPKWFASSLSATITYEFLAFLTLAIYLTHLLNLAILFYEEYRLWNYSLWYFF